MGTILKLLVLLYLLTSTTPLNVTNNLIIQIILKSITSLYLRRTKLA